MWAMSVRENAKSNCHRKTHRVESGGTGRKFMVKAVKLEVNNSGSYWNASLGAVKSN